MVPRTNGRTAHHGEEFIRTADVFHTKEVRASIFGAGQSERPNVEVQRSRPALMSATYQSHISVLPAWVHVRPVFNLVTPKGDPCSILFVFRTPLRFVYFSRSALPRSSAALLNTAALETRTVVPSRGPIERLVRWTRATSQPTSPSRVRSSTLSASVLLNAPRCSAATPTASTVSLELFAAMTWPTWHVASKAKRSNCALSGHRRRRLVLDERQIATTSASTSASRNSGVNGRAHAGVPHAHVCGSRIKRLVTDSSVVNGTSAEKLVAAKVLVSDAESSTASTLVSTNSVATCWVRAVMDLRLLAATSAVPPVVINKQGATGSDEDRQDLAHPSRMAGTRTVTLDC